MDNPIDQLLQNFEEVPQEVLLEIIPLVEMKSIPAGEIFLEPGSQKDLLCYITKGLVRMFQILENGDEKNLIFRWENTFFGNYDTIAFDQPIRFYYQAIEPTDVLQISYAKLVEFIDKNPALAKTERRIMLHIIGELLGRNEDFVLLSAEERYAKQLAENKTIIHRVHDKHMASLLGVTPVSLSRIKKRLLKGN